MWVNLHDIVKTQWQVQFYTSPTTDTHNSENHAFRVHRTTLKYWDGKNTFYYKRDLGYFVQSSYWYLKKWICWHVHYHQNCSTNLSIYSITSAVRVTIVWASTSPQRICCHRGHFYVRYRNWLSAYVCVNTCLTCTTVLPFGVLFVYSCVLCDLGMHFNVP